eukprot:4376-Heterococcus_DN1.PRE.1
MQPVLVLIDVQVHKHSVLRLLDVAAAKLYQSAVIEQAGDAVVAIQAVPEVLCCWTSRHSQFEQWVAVYFRMSVDHNVYQSALNKGLSAGTSSDKAITHYSLRESTTADMRTVLHGVYSKRYITQCHSCRVPVAYTTVLQNTAAY